MLQSSTNTAPSIAHLISHAFNISADIVLMFQLVTLQFERFILMHYCKAVQYVTAVMRWTETLGLRPAVVFKNKFKVFENLDLNTGPQFSLVRPISHLLTVSSFTIYVCFL